MTTGILYSWCDHEDSPYPYALLVEAAGERASRHLDLPYAVTTFQPVGWEKDRVFEGGKRGKFLNVRMVEALRESPYDVTLFMDSDFIVQTDALRLELNRFTHSADDMMFLTDANVSEFVGGRPDNSGKTWSTVFAYKKTEAVSQFFDLVAQYSHNWDWVVAYKNMAPTAVYRNDVAFELAFDALTHRATRASSFGEHYQCWFSRVKYDPDTRLLTHEGKDVGKSPLDTHAMNKDHLLELLDG